MLWKMQMMDFCNHDYKRSGYNNRTFSAPTTWLPSTQRRQYTIERVTMSDSTAIKCEEQI